jgi:hypothetical protein
MKVCVILRLHDEQVAEYYGAADVTDAIIQAERQYPHHTVMAWFEAATDERPTCPMVEAGLWGSCQHDPACNH